MYAPPHRPTRQELTEFPRHDHGIGAARRDSRPGGQLGLPVRGRRRWTRGGGASCSGGDGSGEIGDLPLGATWSLHGWRSSGGGGRSGQGAGNKPASHRQRSGRSKRRTRLIGGAGRSGFEAGKAQQRISLASLLPTGKHQNLRRPSNIRSHKRLHCSARQLFQVKIERFLVLL